MKDKPNYSHFWFLLILGAISTGLYCWLQELSFIFELGQAYDKRPIPKVLILFTCNFAMYLLAIWLVRRTAQTRALLGMLFAFAVAFRVILCLSTPIQEVDIYRYIWDGAVVNEGISPFRFTPQKVQVELAYKLIQEGEILNQKDSKYRFAEKEVMQKVYKLRSAMDSAEMQKLHDRCRQDQPLFEILTRIHYLELPSVYPTTSQIAFAFADRITPTGVPLTTRVRIMKAVLIGFDLGTAVLVMLMLLQVGMAPGLFITYAWCPLLIKEISNSGHLDAVAVFFTALSIFLLFRAINEIKPINQDRWFNGNLLASATTLAFAVGAKLFPIVLVPLFACVTVSRLGWKSLLFPTVICGTLTLALLWPMLPKDSNEKTVANQVSETDPSEGMKKFLTHWEMNDLLFMIMIENLKSTKQNPTNDKIWFSFLSRDVRQSVTLEAANIFTEAEEARLPFLTTRLVTSLIFLILAFYFARNAILNPDLRNIGNMVFLTVAWFWLLSPTQNPWYWTCLLYTSPSPRDRTRSRMPSSA